LRGDREEEGTEEEEEEEEEDPNQSKKVAPRDQKVCKNVSQTIKKASRISQNRWLGGRRTPKCLQEAKKPKKIIFWRGSRAPLGCPKSQKNGKKGC